MNITGPLQTSMMVRWKLVGGPWQLSKSKRHLEVIQTIGCTA